VQVDTGPLVGALTAAHQAVAARLAALEGATAVDRANRLAELAGVVHATADAEEAVLFPVVRRLVEDSGVLTEACAAEHREVADRIDAIASNLDAAGFTAAVHALGRDVRNHMADEESAALPLLAEALDPETSADLADRFRRAVHL
jgi:iron-sulfur cluster repair protein YtfE (RIC family)